MIITLEHCKDLNDNEIVARSLDNLDYFSCLYQRYEPELMRYIHRVAGVDTEESRDILQEAFIKVWRNLNEFDDSLKFSSWVYRIVHNETISHIRKKKSYGKDRTRDAELYSNILADDPETAGEADETHHRLALIPEILDRLPIKYREVLVLKFLEMKSYEEISDILKIPEGTVAIRINRAKKHFRELVGKHHNSST